MPKVTPKPRHADNVAIGRAIRTRREMLGLTLVDLGEAIGRSEGQMSKFESGTSALTYPQIVEIAKHLRTTPEALVKEAARPIEGSDAELQALIAALPAERQHALLDFLRGKTKKKA